MDESYVLLWYKYYVMYRGSYSLDEQEVSMVFTTTEGGIRRGLEPDADGVFLAFFGRKRFHVIEHPLDPQTCSVTEISLVEHQTIFGTLGVHIYSVPSPSELIGWLLSILPPSGGFEVLVSLGSPIKYKTHWGLGC